MKELNLYQCDICGTQFAHKDLCQKCEQGHVQQIEIIKIRYLPITQDKSGMPTTITLTGPDGKHYVYKR